MTHICVSKLTIIGSDNGLSPGQRQAIIWTNDGILLIGPSGTNFSEILIEILTFLFKKMRLKVSSAKRRPFCLGLNVLNFRQNTHKSPSISRVICGDMGVWCKSKASFRCYPDSNVGWANVGPTSGRQYRRWVNVGPTYIAVWVLS